MWKKSPLCKILKKKKYVKNKAAAATQMFHWYNIENQRHGINKDYLPNNTALVPFFGNYRDDKSALLLFGSPCYSLSSCLLLLLGPLRPLSRRPPRGFPAPFLILSSSKEKWRAEELYSTAPRLHKSWPKALAVTWHTIKRNSNSNVSNVRKTDRWIQLYYTKIHIVPLVA